MKISTLSRPDCLVNNYNFAECKSCLSTAALMGEFICVIVSLLHFKDLLFLPKGVFVWREQYLTCTTAFSG